MSKPAVAALVAILGLSVPAFAEDAGQKKVAAAKPAQKPAMAGQHDDHENCPMARGGMMGKGAQHDHDDCQMMKGGMGTSGAGASGAMMEKRMEQMEKRLDMMQMMMEHMMRRQEAPSGMSPR
jgi:hypothetical protein